MVCAQCVDAHITATPEPFNGTYGPGETIEFCVEIDNWQQINGNWMHSIIPDLVGNGWEVNSLMPSGQPMSCSGSGTWLWDSAFGIWGYDTDLNNQPPGPEDGNPFNNWGDNFTGSSCTTYCFTATTVSPGNCIEGALLKVEASINPDSETGNRDSSGCSGDEATPFMASLTCCPNVDLTVSSNSPLCSGELLQIQASTSYTGNDIFYVLQLPDGSSVGSVTGGFTVTNPSTYIYSVELVTDACSVMKEIQVNVDLVIPTAITVLDNVCYGGQFGMNISGAPQNGAWEGPNILNPGTGTFVGIEAVNTGTFEYCFTLDGYECGFTEDCITIEVPDIVLPPIIDPFFSICLSEISGNQEIEAFNPNTTVSQQSLLWYGESSIVVDEGSLGNAQSSLNPVASQELPLWEVGIYNVWVLVYDHETDCLSDPTQISIQILNCPCANVVSDTNTFDFCSSYETGDIENEIEWNYTIDESMDSENVEVQYFFSGGPFANPSNPTTIPPFIVNDNMCETFSQSYYAYLYCNPLGGFTIPMSNQPVLSDDEYLYLGTVNFNIYPDLSDIEVLFDETNSCCPQPIIDVSTNYPCFNEGYVLSNSVDAENSVNPDCSNLGNTGTIIYTLSNSNYPHSEGDIEYMESCAKKDFIIDYDCLNNNRLKLKIWLEGPNNGAALSTALNNQGLLPNNQPFNTMPIFYGGVESITSSTSDIVDWIYVELRDANDLNVVVDRRAVLLRNDGALIDIDGLEGILFYDAIIGENYHIAIFPRGHLAFASSFFFEWPFTGVFDFTATDVLALGIDQLKFVNGEYAAYAGDFNADGIINTLDFNLWFQNSAATNIYASYDVDLNGIINVNDFTLWFENRSKVGVNEVMW